MKIMVVDDEPLINQYIVQCIRNADSENEIIGAVTSGGKALDMLEKTPVDLVFADITMPKMDGIELLREIKKRDPSVSVIMLTCHDEFEYARAAMQYQASNYILKNEVSVERIRSILEEMKQERKEYSAKGVAQQISRNNYLRRLIEQDGSVQPIRESELRANHIYLNDQAFLIVVFCNSGHNIDQMQKSLTDGFENPLFYAYSGQEMYLLVNVRRGSSLAQDNRAAAVFRGIQAEMDDAVGCSRVHYHLEKLQKAFAEAVADRDERFYQLPAETVVESEEKSIRQMEAYIMHATLQIEEREIGKGCAEITKLMSYAQQQHVRVSFLKEAMLQLFAGIRVKLDVNLQEQEHAIQISRTYEEMLNCVRQGLDLLRGHGKVYSEPIQRAIDYIDFHYTEDISLNMVADFVYLNRDYLSRQFKKEVGVNFSEFLMKMRLRRAKRLLETTNMRISDVALSVGITNMSYFSTVFHKSFGCKPNDIRKKRKIE